MNSFLKRKCLFLQLQGDIVAPNSKWTNDKASLLTFTYVNRLIVHGYGQIDGRGQLWWDLFDKKVDTLIQTLLSPSSHLV